MKEKIASQDAPRKGGRKPLQAGVPTVPVMVKMTELQKAKLQRLGGAPWVRERINKAKDPQNE